MEKITRKDFIDIMKDTPYVKKKISYNKTTYEINYDAILNSIAGYSSYLGDEVCGKNLSEFYHKEAQRIMDEITARIRNYYQW